MSEHGTLYDYWMALYRRRVAILFVSLSAAVFAYLISLALPPVYEAKSAFYLPVVSGAPPYTADPGAGQTEKAPLMPVTNEKEGGVHLGILKGEAISTAILEQFPSKTRSDLNLNVDFVMSEYFLTEVYVRDLDPEVAAAIANAYPVAYKAFHGRSMANRSAFPVKALENQVASIEKSLAKNLAAQQQHRDRNVSSSVVMESLRTEYRNLAALLDSTQKNLIEAKLKQENPAVELVLVERASAPTKPTFPRPILNTIVSLIFGLAAGCYYALFLEYLTKLRRYRLERTMDTAPLEAANGETV